MLEYDLSLLEHLMQHHPSYMRNGEVWNLPLKCYTKKYSKKFKNIYQASKVTGLPVVDILIVCRFNLVNIHQKSTCGYFGNQPLYWDWLPSKRIINNV